LGSPTSARPQSPSSNAMNSFAGATNRVLQSSSWRSGRSETCSPCARGRSSTS
jgi:hypothetical protein